MNEETASDMYTVLCVKRIINENLLYVQHTELYSVFCGDLNGKEI